MIVYVIVERKRGPAETADYGHNVGAMGLEALDRYLQGTGATPLSAFLHEDLATLEQALQVAQPAERLALERRLEELRAQPDWHDPHDGLRTVQALLARLPSDESHDGVRGDLQIYQRRLTAAAEANDEFRLNTRTGE